jgi:tripartite-type tricarboxylate transporter receptor subunit TctC
MGRVIERHRALALALAAVVWTGPAASLAQTAATSPQGFPGKSVRYVIPFGAGGSPDLVGRLLADRLTRMWGQQVIVDNRVGAAGVVGTAYVAKSPPDGYTLLQCNIASSAIAVTLYSQLPYDQLRDIAPVTRIGMTPNLLTVHPSVQIHSIKAFIAYARANPGKLSYASGLAGTSPHLSMELFKMLAKIDVVHIPYKVGAQGISDNVAGQVPVGISNFPAGFVQVLAKRLRPIAVTSATRATQLAAVPTIEESGFPGYDVSSWYGVCAPAGTPAALLDKLHADINAALRVPELTARLDELVVRGAPTTREEFEQFIRSEIDLWARVIRDTGIPQQ